MTFPSNDGRSKQASLVDGGGVSAEGAPPNLEAVVNALADLGMEALAQPSIRLGLKRLAGFREPAVTAALLDALKEHGLDDEQALAALREYIPWPPIEENQPTDHDDTPRMVRELRRVWLRVMANREIGVSATEILKNAASDGARAIAHSPIYKPYIVDALEELRGAGNINPDEGQEIIAQEFRNYEEGEHGSASAKGSRAEQSARKIKDHIVTIQASQVMPKRIEWIWPGRFALGKLGLIGGFPDVGKSQLAIDMIARVTRGDQWPCDEGRAPKGDALLFCSEDDPADTVVPRLIAADADLSGVHIVKMVGTKSGGETVFSIVQHLPMLREKIEEIPGLVMVVIDPLAAHLGIGQVNSFRTTDIRAALTPLVQIAQDKRLSVIGVMHFNKSQNVTNAMLRISDSLAFVAQARHCYVAIEDPEMEGRFLFVRAKNNLGARSRQALAYGITTRPVAVDGGNVEVPCVAWDLKHVDGRATDMIEQALGPRTGRPGKAEDAIEFLRAELAEGSLPSEQVFERGRKEGFSDRTLSRAKRAAGVVSRKIGSNGGWVWELADAVR